MDHSYRPLRLYRIRGKPEFSIAKDNGSGKVRRIYHQVGRMISAFKRRKSSCSARSRGTQHTAKLIALRLHNR
jgi:hypothetical protein